MTVLQTPTAHSTRLNETCARLEHLITLEIRPFSGGLPVGIVAPTADISRHVQGGSPLQNAALGLIGACNDQSHVLIVTGAGVAPALPAGETDGPLGAVVLARGIARTTNAQVTLLCEERHLPPIENCLAVLENTESIKLQPVANEVTRNEIAGLMPGTLNAVVFIEKDGPNEKGNFHGIRGNRRPDRSVTPLHCLADLARERKILTIGVGDGGNEVGFGKIRRDLEAILPNGGKVRFGNEGVITVTETDILVTASVSNWGGYAINAALALAFDSPELLHSPEEEIKLIEAAIAGGARDGATSRPDLAVDGISCAGNAAVTALIKDIVQCALNTPEPIEL